MLRHVRDAAHALRTLVLPEGQYVFFKAYKAQVAARALPQPSRYSHPPLPALATVVPPSPAAYMSSALSSHDGSPPTAAYMSPPPYTPRSPPHAQSPRYASPGLPSPTELSPTPYSHRFPEDQRAIQAFQRYSPPAPRRP